MLLFWFFIFVLTLIALMFVLKPLLFNRSVVGQQFYLLSALFIILIPFVGILLYLHWGSSQEITRWYVMKKNAQVVEQQIRKYGSRQKIILALHEKLLQLPEDANSAKGWHLLGKLYFNEKNMKQAINAFQKAVKLKSDQSEYILDLVSTRFYVNHHLSVEDEKLINKLLILSPKDVNAVNLLALNAYQQNNFVQAIRYWESLLSSFQPESEDSKNLLEMIRQAQNKSTSINIIVDIAKNLQDKIDSKNILYVYALEDKDAKIPLAVAKLQVNHFPVELTLGNQQSMMPNHTLNNAEQILIKARISKTGNAISTKGDLLGVSYQFNIKLNKDKKIRIIIDQVMKNLDIAK